MPRKPVKRFTSVRAYRRMIDEILAQAKRGEIPWREARAAVASLKSAAEMVLAENLMKAQEIEDREPEHPDGIDGGYEDYAPHKKARRAVTTTRASKTVSNQHGTFDEESEKTVH